MKRQEESLIQNLDRFQQSCRPTALTTSCLPRRDEAQRALFWPPFRVSDWRHISSGHQNAAGVGLWDRGLSLWSGCRLVTRKESGGLLGRLCGQVCLGLLSLVSVPPDSGHRCPNSRKGREALCGSVAPVVSDEDGRVCPGDQPCHAHHPLHPHPHITQNYGSLGIFNAKSVLT